MVVGAAVVVGAATVVGASVVAGSAMVSASLSGGGSEVAEAVVLTAAAENPQASTSVIARVRRGVGFIGLQLFQQGDPLLEGRMRVKQSVQ